MIVVADTSPLNYLVLIQEIEILRSLYGTVVIPEEVLSELEDPGAPAEVAAWIARRPDWIDVRVADPIGNDPALLSVDPGERAAILLAQRELEVLLIIDDAAGRAEANRRNLPNTGTLGVLREAARRGLVDLPLALNRLMTTNFRVSRSLVRALLEENAARLSGRD